MYKSIFFLALILTASSAFGQSATPASIPAAAVASDPAAPQASPAPIKMPSNPNEYLQKAAQLNGLTGADIKPWHLKATFQVYDDAGKVKDTGTYEELWVSDKKYKRIYTLKGLTETEYGTEKGNFVSHPKNRPNDLTGVFYSPQILHGIFGTPLPPPEDFKNESAKKTNEKINKLNYINFTLSSGTSYIFNANIPVIRMTRFRKVCLACSEYLEVVYNRIGTFQGHYFSGDVKINLMDNPIFSAHLDSIGLLETVQEGDFVPPPDAESRPILNPKDIHIGKPITTNHMASEQLIFGSFVVQGLIDKTGHLHNLSIIGGSKMRVFQNYVLSNVSEWVLEPCRLKDEPAEFPILIYLDNRGSTYRVLNFMEFINNPLFRNQ